MNTKQFAHKQCEIFKTSAEELDTDVLLLIEKYACLVRGLLNCGTHEEIIKNVIVQSELNN